MKRLFSLVLVLASLPGCLAINTQSPSDGGEGCPGSDAGPPPDLATPAPKCAAARGLAGDNLLCVDFNAVSGLSDPKLRDWNFNCTMGLWVIQDGKLQVNNFSTFMSTCTFQVPAVSAADYAKYNRFTLSVVQRVDLNELSQKAQILLGADDPPTRLLLQLTGKQPRQRNVYEVQKGDLPLPAMGGFQPLFKISSTVQAGTANAGWQIESIAIQGVQ